MSWLALLPAPQRAPVLSWPAVLGLPTADEEVQGLTPAPALPIWPLLFCFFLFVCLNCKPHMEPLEQGQDSLCLWRGVCPHPGPAQWPADALGLGQSTLHTGLHSAGAVCSWLLLRRAWELGAQHGTARPPKEPPGLPVLPGQARPVTSVLAPEGSWVCASGLPAGLPIPVQCPPAWTT